MASMTGEMGPEVCGRAEYLMYAKQTMGPISTIWMAPLSTPFPLWTTGLRYFPVPPLKAADLLENPDAEIEARMGLSFDDLSLENHGLNGHHLGPIDDHGFDVLDDLNRDLPPHACR